MKPLMLLSAVVGILLIVLAVVYFAMPANQLPSFIPGADTALTKHHYTHGVGSLILGLGALAFAWFQSGKKAK